MKKIMVLALVTIGSLALATAADARGGCGYAWHRGPWGGCRHNGIPVMIAPVPHRFCPVGSHRGPYGRRCFRN